MLIFLFCLNYFAIKAKLEPELNTSNWVLDIKNENYTDELIELRPGVLTKIVLIVRHEENIDFLDRSFDRTNFTIATKDNMNIVFYPNETFNIIPSKSLEYFAYIGLKCDHEINSENYTLELEVKQKTDLDRNNIEYGNLVINPVPVKINNIVTLIDIEPVETNLTIDAFSLLRIKKEIYNMEKVKISTEATNKKRYSIKDAEIQAFRDRKMLKETESENHGILFDYKFGPRDTYEKLKGETTGTFLLRIENDDNHRRCFDINPKYKSFNITINQRGMLVLNDSVEEAVIYSLEDITPKRDKTNNIQLKVNLPVFPVLLTCKLKGEGNNEEIDNIKYNNYFVNPGPNIIKINNLNSNKQYKGDCKFYTIVSRKTEFKILIGKDSIKSNNVLPFYPSSSSYTTPQCLLFTFTSQNKDNLEDKIQKFTDLAEKICNKTLAEEKTIDSRILGKYMCAKSERLDTKVEDNYYHNRAIICTGTSPLYNPETIEEGDIEKSNSYYEKQVDKFIGLVNTTEKINSILSKEEDMADLELIDIKRYYDLNPPDMNKIKLEYYEKRGMSRIDKFNFKITSSNEQPIECFFNREMRSDDNKKLVNLYNNKNAHKSVILSMNEEKKFETKLKDRTDDNMYPLYMNCYNLPGAKIRFQQTGIFIGYTYLYTDVEDQSIVEKQKVKIKCNQKNNKMNPNCFKEQYNNLYGLLKTKMPEADENEGAEKFSKLSNDAQIDLLDKMFKNFDEEMTNIKSFTQIIESLIKKEQFLSNRDCLFNANGSNSEINSSEYQDCRENKKIKQKKIIDFLNTNFNCDYLSLLISQNGISNDVEDNMKHIILLVNEVINNADSFGEGDSKVLYNMMTCLEENYEFYWNHVENYLQKKKSLNVTISAVKKDISNLLINSMANLVKVLHFDEIDNYISENEKNITNKGLMSYKQGKQVYNNIKHFMKYFNEFGDGIYNLSDSLIINININNDYKELAKNNSLEDDEKAIVYKDKGIVLLLRPQSMMKYYNAYAMQVLNYESPLISIKGTKKNNNVYNTFISITLYDDKGNEIKIDNIPEDIRPNILYDKKHHNYMNKCYFYNEEIEDLAEDGVSINTNYIYNGKPYLKCTAEHLTCFTAGNYFFHTTSNVGKAKENVEQKRVMTLILLAGIFFAIFIFVLLIAVVKKKRMNDNAKRKFAEIELV